MNDIVFDSLKHEYIQSLTELENLCFSVPWTKAMVEGDIINKNAFYVLAVADGRVVAYCGLYKVLDEADITNIAVLPEYRRKGIAKALLGRIFNHCLNENITKITIEVRESNISAISLYEKIGFIPVGARKNYYSDNGETAILMTKHIKEVS